MTVHYDPPSGWRYGFPRPYLPEPGETLADTLLRDGYPQREIDNGGAKYCRFIGERAELDAIAQRHVEHDNDNSQQDNLPVAEQPAGRIETEASSRARFQAMLDGKPEPAKVYERHGSFMQTFTGRQFWPMDPRASEVFIEDIAHSLAMQTRYAGHCLRFYSVAEHSVLLARYFRRQGASVDVQLWALLHDASEAYLVDVPRPVKPFLAGYKAAEARVMRAICDRFDLAHEMPAEVHAADGAIIGNERANMAPCVAEWYATGQGLDGVYLRNWRPEVAELEFLAEFKRLMDERHEAEREPMDPFELAADRSASRADFENKARREAA